MKLINALPACALLATVVLDASTGAYAQAQALTTVQDSMVLSAPESPAPALPELPAVPASAASAVPEVHTPDLIKKKETRVRSRRHHGKPTHRVGKKKPKARKAVHAAASSSVCLPVH